MFIQARFFSSDRKKKENLLRKVTVWRNENDQKFVITKMLKSSLIFVLPKYNNDEFRLIEPLKGLTLSLVCEEYIEDDKAEVVCDQDGQKLLPFWTSNGKVNAKFFCGIDGLFVTVRAKKNEDGISIILHEVSVSSKGDSFHIEKKQLVNMKAELFFKYWIYAPYFEAAKIVVEKLEKNNKFPCFIQEKS